MKFRKNEEKAIKTEHTSHFIEFSEEREINRTRMKSVEMMFLLCSLGYYFFIRTCAAFQLKVNDSFTNDL